MAVDPVSSSGVWVGRCADIGEAPRLDSALHSGPVLADPVPVAYGPVASPSSLTASSNCRLVT